MLSIQCVRLTIKVKMGIPESFKVGWYHPKKTGSSRLKLTAVLIALIMLKSMLQLCACQDIEHLKVWRAFKRG